MTINSSFVNSTNVSDATDTTIQMLNDRPPVGISVFNIPYQQNQLLGYYDATIGLVELFVADPLHSRYLRL